MNSENLKNTWSQVLYNSLPSEARFQLVKNFSLGRAFLFFQESLPLLAMDLALNPQLRKGKKTKISVQKILLAYKTLLEQDAKNIADGLYPISVLTTKTPVEHSLGYAQVLKDAVGLSFRKRKNKHKEFKTSIIPGTDELPEYYVRNFHYQTDGYLSKESAEIYDHQVDILFRGMTGAMRRMMLAPIKEQFGDKSFTALEIACGAGSATIDFARTFPQAKLTAIDLSKPYLEKAKLRLREFANVGFEFGDGSGLVYPGQSYDLVFSVFLFHELPLEIRLKTLTEMKRVLKSGGLVVIIDSIQKGDNEAFDPALELFPKAFHEPFYTNYVNHPLESLLAQAGFKDITVKIGGSSKMVSAKL